MKETRRKNNAIYIRVSDKEKEQIYSLAKELNYPSVSRYIIDTCLSPTLFIEDPSGYQKIYSEVNKIGTNINQIAKYVNTYKTVTADELIAVNKELNKIKMQLETLRMYRHFEKVEIEYGSH